MSEQYCPCGSVKTKDLCCLPYINGEAFPDSAELLMRSRYTAYTLHNADYIYNTTSPSERKHHSKKSILSWAKSCHFIKLDIIYAKDAVVEFKAYYLDGSLRSACHHERSFFENIEGLWYYKEGIYP